MVDRSIAIRLRADVGQYIAGLGRASRATDDFANAGQRANQSAQGFPLLAKGAGVAAGAFALGVVAAGKASADFDKAMSGVRANIDGAGVDFKALGDGIRSAGTEFGFSAVEAANGAEELAKAGLSASQIMGGALTGAMTLAAAGEVSVGNAAETAATAMSMFGLEAKDVSKIADVLANGANQSTASVDSLSQALRQGGGVAASFGLTLEDTVATLAMFDQNGLKGSDAGTSLKTMLTALANPSKKAALAMEDLGIKTFDASGKFIGMAALQDQLREKTKGLTDEQRAQAFATIFGSDAMRAANVLMKDDKGFETWAAGVNKTGTAAENARTRLDNLTGDLGKLRAALENALIGGGSGLSNGLRPVVQSVTSLVGLVSQIPGPVFTGAAAVGAMVAAGAGIAKVVALYRALKVEMLAVQAIGMAAAVSNLTAAGFAAGTAALGLGRVGTAIALIGTRIPIIASMQTAYLAAAAGATRFSVAAGSSAAASTLASAAATRLSAALKTIAPLAAVVAAAFAADKITDWSVKSRQGAHDTKTLAKELAELGKSGKSSGEAMRLLDGDMSKWQVNAKGHFASLSDGFSDIADWVGNLQDGSRRSKEFESSVRRMDGALTALVNGGKADQAKAAFDRLMQALDPSDRKDAAAMFKGYNAALDATKEKAAAAVSPAKAMADAIEKTGDKASGSAADLDALAKAIKGVSDAQLGARADARGYQAALDDATASLKENGRTLDISTDKGRKNQEALDGISSSASEWAASIVQTTGDVSRANGVLESGRKQYVDMAVAMGMPRAEAEKLAKSLLTLPSGISIPLAVPGLAGSTLLVDQFGKQVYGLAGTKISVPVETPNAQSVVQVLASVKTSALSLDGKTVSISTAALGAENTKSLLANIKGARENANGTVSIPTSALNAASTQKWLTDIGAAATTADGKTVIIPASTPNAPAVISLLRSVRGAQLTADGKSVTIRSAAPMAPDTIAKLRGIKGAQVSADGKSVTVSTAAPGAANATSQILGAGSAADRVDGKRSTITVTTIREEIFKRSFQGHTFSATAQAIGGPAGIPSYASGGAARGYTRGGKVTGAGTRTSDSILTRLSSGLVRLSNLEHVVTADEVDKMGGHGAMYALRAAARAGKFRVPGYASGGAAAGSNWSPDMSGIQAMLSAMKADPQALTDSRTRLKERTDALAKATRDLETARARFRQVMSGRHTAAQELSARNKIADAVAKEAKAQRELNSAKATNNTLTARSKMSASQRFTSAVAGRSKVTAQFIADITKIKRYDPDLARTLLEQNDEDAVAAARSYAASGLASIRAGGKALRANNVLEQRRASIFGSSASAADRAAANAQTIALQRANASFARGGGVIVTPTITIPTKQIADVVRAEVRAISFNAHLVTNLDGDKLTQTVTKVQATSAAQGSTTVGVY